MKKIFHTYGPYLFLLILAGLVFHASPDFDFVNWDDGLYVRNNVCVRHAERCDMEKQFLTPYLGYPAPLTIASYRAEVVIGGPDARTVHVVNLLLHILIVMGLFWLLKTFTKNTLLALMGASVFLVHPITAEVVGWASDRKELLCALFSMFSVLAYQKQGRTLRGLAFAMLLWLLATSAKPTALLLFLVYPVIDLAEGHISLKRLMFYLSALAIAITDVVLSMRFEQNLGAIHTDPSISDRMREVMISAFVHTKVAVWPMVHLPKYLEAPNPQWWKFVIGAFVLIALSYLAIRAIIKKRPEGLWWSGALALYIPISGIMPLSRRFSDSYCYPPLLFFIAGLIIVLARSNSRIRVYAAILMSLLVVVWSAMTIQELGKWQNGTRLWSLMYQEYPDSPQVCRNLGNSYISGHASRPDKAAKVYEMCMSMPGANRDFYMKNLGIALLMDKKTKRAVSVLSDFLTRHPNDPKAVKYLRIARGILNP